MRVRIAPIYNTDSGAFSVGASEILIAGSLHGKSRTEGRTGCRLRDAGDLPAIRYQPGQLIPYKKLRCIVNVIDCQHLPAIEIGGTVISLASVLVGANKHVVVGGRESIARDTQRFTPGIGYAQE